MSRLIFPIITVLLIVASGCDSSKFEKLENGLEYKIIPGKDGKQIQNGNFLKMTVAQYYQDSLITPSPVDTIPQIIMIDSMSVPPEYITIFTKAKVGDSIITRISTDTIAKHQPLPPFAKPHQFISTRIKILDVYTNQNDAEVANAELRERLVRADSLMREDQKLKDDATIVDYLKKNNIQAVKSPEGTYVEVSTVGNGPKADSGKAVSVLYKGKLFDGKIFDESYDSTGTPTNPFTFILGSPGAIAGWSDGLAYFNEGSEGRLFIPSGRAYGPRGAGADIAPNTPLIFEVKVTKVQSQEDYRKEMEAAQKKAQAEQEEQMKTAPPASK